MLPFHVSASVRPSRPWIRFAIGTSVTWKPVPKMIVSTSRSVPSPATTESGLISLTPPVITSTLGCARAGYHSSVGKMRLQPMR
jgi:hypothetical protein